MKLVVTSNAQEREVTRFGERNAAFVRALMSMQRLTYLAGGLPGLILAAGTGAVSVYGGLRVIRGDITVGTFIAFMAYQMRFLPPLQALMEMYAQPGDPCASRWHALRRFWTSRSRCRSAPMPSRCRRSAATSSSRM